MISWKQYLKFIRHQHYFNRFDFYHERDKTVSNEYDNTPYISAENIDKLISVLERASKTLFKWFGHNRLKAKADKCHLLVSGTQKANAKIEHFCISNGESEKTLGMKFDCKFSFNGHVSDLCKKTSLKLIDALAKIAPYITMSKRQVLVNAFFRSHFNYCPLIWVYHSCKSN